MNEMVTAIICVLSIGFTIFSIAGFAVNEDYQRQVNDPDCNNERERPENQCYEVCWTTPMWYRLGTWEHCYWDNDR